MGSIDQILLLQKKVNTAVEKIRQMNDLVTQLKSENDALRRKCAELTNSLEDKTELVSSMEAEQIQIEESIKRALDQLDEVENSVLTVGAQQNLAVTETPPHSQPESPVQAQTFTAEPTIESHSEVAVEATVKETPSMTAPVNNINTAAVRPVITQPVNQNLDPLAASLNVAPESEVPVPEQTTDEDTEETGTSGNVAQLDIF